MCIRQNDEHCVIASVKVFVAFEHILPVLNAFDLIGSLSRYAVCTRPASITKKCGMQDGLLFHAKFHLVGSLVRYGGRPRPRPQCGHFSSGALDFRMQQLATRLGCMVRTCL